MTRVNSLLYQHRAFEYGEDDDHNENQEFYYGMYECDSVRMRVCVDGLCSVVQFSNLKMHVI